ncbi:MAG: leucine-rich repeat domain-containing protein [Paludibacteraceae bacterium]|nr:leucine-rich repeat domain-containing protein [Paludibacteraceae bacterium]
MKKSFFLIISFLCATAAYALTVTAEGAQYRINASKYTAELVEVTDSAITSFSVPAFVTINDNKFSVVSLGKAAFAECTELTRIVLPEGLIEIGPSAFEDCWSLTEISFPSSLLKIDDHAFWGCTKLQTIMLPPNLKILGAGVFGHCAIKSLFIPKEVMYIGEYTATTCNDLTEIKVDERNINYDSRNGCNAIIHTPSKTLVCGCQSSTIPQGVVSIQAHAFEECWGVESVTLPEGLKMVGDSAFRECYHLASVSFPNTLYGIGNSAFEQCNALRTVTLPEGLVYIGNRAFRNCNQLGEVAIPGSVREMGQQVFEVIDESKLVVEEWDEDEE